MVVAQPQNTNASSRENAFLDLLFAIEDQTAETAATKELDAAEMEVRFCFKNKIAIILETKWQIF